MASPLWQFLTHAAAPHQALQQLPLKSRTKRCPRSSHDGSPAFSLVRNLTSHREYWVCLSRFTFGKALLHFIPLSTCFVTLPIYVCSQPLVTNGGKQVVCVWLLLSLNADKKSTLVATPRRLPLPGKNIGDSFLLMRIATGGVPCHRYKKSRG